MTIEEYIKDYPEREVINGINFCLFGVEYYKEIDVNEKTPFDENIENEWYSFLERLEKAQKEIEEDTKDKTLEEVKEYYKGLTDKGNHYYWGEMIWIPTNDIDDDDCIYYGVRMD